MVLQITFILIWPSIVGRMSCWQTDPYNIKLVSSCGFASVLFYETPSSKWMIVRVKGIGWQSNCFFLNIIYYLPYKICILKFLSLHFYTWHSNLRQKCLSEHRMWCIKMQNYFLVFTTIDSTDPSGTYQYCHIHARSRARVYSRALPIYTSVAIFFDD